MRLLLPSAAIAILAGTCSSSAVASDISASDASKVTKHVELAYSQAPLQRSRSTDPSSPSEGEECNSFIADRLRNNEPDVGVLACSQPQQVCMRDVASSLGGRCRDRRPRDNTESSIPIFQKRRRATQKLSNRSTGNQTPRFLQNPLFVCPANCPEDFCKCAKKQGNGVACSKELNAICIDGTLSECVPEDYVYYYEETYCPFAGCMVDGGTYAECECEFRANYCNLYYEFEESTESCAIAACCEKTEDKKKHTCIPELMPTTTPSAAPSQTDPPTTVKPSSMPSTSSAPSTSAPTSVPSLSLAPSASTVPSSMPSTSSAPSTSSYPSVLPTSSPSSSPSGTPTIAPTSTPTSTPSSSPTGTPTIHPTSIPSSTPSSSPTGTPTLSPTSIPSSTPSYSPSSSPSSAPSVSFAPSESSKPSTSPTATTSPTTSSSPTSQPSVSTSPSSAPSLSPSTSMSPSTEPSTSPPTDSPSSSPSSVPSNEPTKEPTKTPTDQSTKVPSADSNAETPSISASPTTSSEDASAPSTDATFKPTETSADSGDTPTDAIESEPTPNGAGLLYSWSSGAAKTSFLMGVSGALWLFAW